MSSLTDIIFLLLIFFMLTSTLVTPNSMNYTLPTSDAQTVAPASVSVSISKKGEFFIGTEKVSRGRMSSEVSKAIKEVKSSGEKDITVTIVAELGAPFEDVTRVLAVAEQNRVKAILATNPN